MWPRTSPKWTYVRCAYSHPVRITSSHALLRYIIFFVAGLISMHHRTIRAYVCTEQSVLAVHNTLNVICYPSDVLSLIRSLFSFIRSFVQRSTSAIKHTAWRQGWNSVGPLVLIMALNFELCTIRTRKHLPLHTSLYSKITNLRFAMITSGFYIDKSSMTN